MQNLQFDYTNKNVLVTGSNRGIGLALVQNLSTRGVRRIYAAARDVSSLNDLLAQYPQLIVPLALDVTSATSLEQAVANVENLDLLINNAGSVYSRSVMTASLEDLTKDFQLNSVSPLMVSRAFLPLLLKSDTPAIVNTLSTVAISNSPGLGGYSMSKAAAYAMSQSLSAELRSQGIGVYYAFPGLTATDLSDGLPGEKATPEEVAQNMLDDITHGTQYIFPAANAKAIEAKWLENPEANAR